MSGSVLLSPSSQAVLIADAGNGSAITLRAGAPFLNPPGAARKIMPLGDSTTICSDVDNAGQGGSWRPAFEARLRSQGISNWEFIGTQVTQTSGAGGLHCWFHEGHGGFTIANVNTNYPTYVASVGAPDIIMLHVGINDIVQGQSVQQMQVSYQTLLNTIYAATPNVVVVIALQTFSAGTTVGGNLTAWNAIVTSINSWMQSTLLPAQLALGRIVRYLDLTFMGVGEHQSDGVHNYRSGLNEHGVRFADLCMADLLLFPPAFIALAKTRLYRVEAPFGGLDFAAAATDTATVASYAGASPNNGPFAFAFEFYPKSLSAGQYSPLVTYGTQGTANFWEVGQKGTQLFLWWGSATNPIVGAAGAYPGTYPGTTLLAQGNCLQVNQWHRIIVLADPVTGRIAMYCNGALIGLGTGIAASTWNMTTTNTLTFAMVAVAGANGSLTSRFHAFQPTSMAAAPPGSNAAAILVERDLFYGCPLYPGAYSSRYDMALAPATVGQALSGDANLTYNGTATTGTPFGNLNGPGFIPKPRAWEYNVPDPGT